MNRIDQNFYATCRDLAHVLPGALNPDGLPDGGRAAIGAVSNPFRLWREQVEPDRSVVLMDTTTFKNALEALGDFPDASLLLDLNTLCAGFIFYDRLAVPKTLPLEAVDFGPLPVRSLTYNVEKMERPFRELWELGQRQLEQWEPEKIWKDFFRGTEIYDFIRWTNFNDYFDSTGTTPTPYPLDKWVEYGGTEFRLSLLLQQEVGKAEMNGAYQRIADLVVVQSHRAAFMDMLASALGIPYLCTAIRSPIYRRLLRDRSFRRWEGCFERAKDICALPSLGAGALGRSSSPNIRIGLPLALVLKRAGEGAGGDHQTDRAKQFWSALASVRSDAQQFREYLLRLETSKTEFNPPKTSPLEPFGKLVDFAWEQGANAAGASFGIPPIATGIVVKLLNVTGWVSGAIRVIAERTGVADRRCVQLLVEQVARLIQPKTHFFLSMTRTAAQLASEPTGVLIERFWGRKLDESQHQWLRLFERSHRPPADA